MSDEADESRRVTQAGLDRSVATIREAAAKIEPGTAGDCDGCGEYFARVVRRGRGHYCARCRDSKGLG